MGFMKDVANVATFGVLGSALRGKKKKTPEAPRPTMISNMPYERPMSMIGAPRGGY